MVIEEGSSNKMVVMQANLNQLETILIHCSATFFHKYTVEVLVGAANFSTEVTHDE